MDVTALIRLHPYLQIQQPAYFKEQIQSLPDEVNGLTYHLERENYRLHTYIDKLEQDRSVKLAELTKLKSELHSLQATRTVRLSKTLANQFRRLQARLPVGKDR